MLIANDRIHRQIDVNCGPNRLDKPELDVLLDIMRQSVSVIRTDKLLGVRGGRITKPKRPVCNDRAKSHLQGQIDVISGVLNQIAAQLGERIVHQRLLPLKGVITILDRQHLKIIQKYIPEGACQ